MPATPLETSRPPVADIISAFRMNGAERVACKGILAEHEVQFSQTEITETTRDMAKVLKGKSDDCIIWHDEPDDNDGMQHPARPRLNALLIEHLQPTFAFTGTTGDERIVNATDYFSTSQPGIYLMKETHVDTQPRSGIPSDGTTVTWRLQRIQDADQFLAKNAELMNLRPATKEEMTPLQSL